jgi:hypothetical protein
VVKECGEMSGGTLEFRWRNFAKLWRDSLLVDYEFQQSIKVMKTVKTQGLQVNHQLDLDCIRYHFFFLDW